MPKLTCLLACWLLAAAASAQPVVAQGTWTRIDYAVQGSWRIEHADGALRVSLDDEFETKNGPDLHILLSPRPLAEIDNDNAADGALVVGLLKTSDRSLLFKKMQGAQSLPLPPGTDLARFRSILIHCVRFSHLWAGAELAR